MVIITKIRRKIYKLFHPAWGEILMLHRVVNDKSTLYNNRLMEVNPGFLEKTIMDYKSKNYRFVSMDEVITYVSAGKRPKQKFVCFTFDDGYRDNYEIAYPVFKKYNVPFTIYITTDFPNRKALLWWYVLESILLENELVKLGDGSVYECHSFDQKNEAFRLIREKIFKLQKYNLAGSLNSLFVHYDYSFEKIVAEVALDWHQIKQLAEEPLCTIASHSVTHAALDEIDNSLIIHELSKSKKELEEKSGATIKHFAYPYGRMNKKVEQEIEKAGYCSSVIADGGKIRRDATLFRLKRIGLIER